MRLEPAMSVSEASRGWVRQHLRTYRCKYCNERYDRTKPNCPKCKTRKGTKGLGRPAGSIPSL